MLKRSSAIGVMLLPGFVAACGGDPVVPDRRSAQRLDNVESVADVASPPATGFACAPFKVNGSAGSVQVSGGPPPAPLDITISAGGHATHLGRYSSVAHGVVTFPSPTTAVFDGGGTFTAANGDEVNFTYRGDFFPGPVPGGLGDYEIVGGTGRFGGATGSGIFSSEGGVTTFDGDICLAEG